MSGAPQGWRGPLLLAVACVATVGIVALLVFRFARPIGDLQARIDAFWAPPPAAPPVTSPAQRQPPAPGPAPRAAAAPRLPAPRYEPRDALRNAPDAYADLMHASQRGDAATVAKYLLRAQLGRKQSVEEALRELAPPVPIESVQILRSKTNGDRAALLLNARAPLVADKQGKPAAIQVVVQMMREDGYWKLFRQRWVNNSSSAQQESEALAWVAAKPAATGR